MGLEAADAPWEAADYVVAVVTSWPAVIILCCLPGLLMLRNFLFGNCDVAVALDRRHGGSAPSGSKLRGRAQLAACMVAFLWQVHAAMTMTLQRPGSPDFWVAASFVTLMNIWVFVAWQVAIWTPPISVGSDLSSCSKCGVKVRHMDHHCFWINNCVGEHNYTSFVSFLAAVMVASIGELILFWHDIDAAAAALVRPSEGTTALHLDLWVGRVLLPSLEVVVGALVAVVMALGAGWLLQQQFYVRVWLREASLLAYKKKQRAAP